MKKVIFTAVLTVQFVLLLASCKNKIIGGGCCNGGWFEVIIGLTDSDGNSLTIEELKSLRITEVGIKENYKKYWKANKYEDGIKIENGEPQLRLEMHYFYRDFHTDEEKLKDTGIIIESVLCKFQKTEIPNLAGLGYIKEKSGEKTVYKFKLKLNNKG